MVGPGQIELGGSNRADSPHSEKSRCYLLHQSFDSVFVVSQCLPVRDDELSEPERVNLFVYGVVMFGGYRYLLTRSG